MRLSPLQRKEIAEKLLKWFKENQVDNCPNTYAVLSNASDLIHEHLYDLWKAFELLRIMGRVELNNPNGKYGFHVIDTTPLSVYQLRTDGFKKEIQKEMLINIIFTLRKRYKTIWDECLKDVSKT